MEEDTLNSKSSDNNTINNGQQPSTTAMDLLCQSEDQYVSKLRELARQQQQDMLLKQQQHQMANNNNTGNGSSNGGGNSHQSSSSPLANLPLPLLAHAASLSPSSVTSPFLQNATAAAAAHQLSSPSNGGSISVSPAAVDVHSNSNNSIHNSSSSSSGSNSSSSIKHFKKKALIMQTSPTQSPSPPPSSVTTGTSQSELKPKLVPYDDDDDGDRGAYGSGDSNQSLKLEEVDSQANGMQMGETDGVEIEKPSDQPDEAKEKSSKSSSVSNKRPAELDEDEVAKQQFPVPKISEPLSVSTASPSSKGIPTKTSKANTPSDTEPLQELKVLLLSPTLPRAKSSPAAVEQAEKVSPPLPKKMKKSDLLQQEISADIEVSMEEASSEVSATSSLETGTGDGSQETATDFSGKTDTDDETSSVGEGSRARRGRHHSSASQGAEGGGILANLSTAADVEMKDIGLGNESSILSVSIQSAASTTSESFDFFRPSGTVSAVPGSQHLLHPGSANFSSTPNSSRAGGNRKSSPSTSPSQHSILQGSPSFSPISNSSPFTTLPEMPTMVTHVGRKPLNGPPCSLKTLVDDGILDPLEGSLTYEILGSKFTGDLLPNGFIRMSATAQVFANPSSWANYCRSTIPSAIKEGKNYGSAWSIIRYLGKRLDSYKLRWYRKQKKSFGGNGGSPSASPSPHSSSSGNLHPSQMMQLMTAGGGGSGTGSGGLGNFHPHQMHHHSRRSATATSAEQLSYTAQLLGLPMGAINAGHHHHMAGGKSNIYSYMNRERLYKLDKISLGDTELNGENINDPNEVVNFASIDLNSRDCLQREDLKVEAVPFAVTGGLQPFLVTVMTNVLMLVDFHAHVVPNEVCGFLGGTWDPRTQHMVITSAYPLMHACSTKKNGLSTSADSSELASKRAEAIARIKSTMRERGTILVGWYHSHVKSSPHPTILDIKKQLRYQKEFLVSPSQKVGKSGPIAEYSPVVGLIVSPYYPRTQRLVSLMQMFWVAPIYVSVAKDFGRPMQFNYTVNRDAFLTQDLLVEMRAVATYYFKKGDFVPFREQYREGVTFWEKLHESMKPKLPRDLIEYVSNEELANEICAQALVHFWTFVRSLLLLDKNPEELNSDSSDKKSPEKKTEKGGENDKEKKKGKNIDKEDDTETEKSAKIEKDNTVESASSTAIAT